MTLLPWKIKPPTTEILGLKIPDHEGLLVLESTFLLYEVLPLQKEEVITPLQGTEVMVAYCLTVRFNLEDEREAIEQAIHDKVYPSAVVDRILPPNLSTKNLNAIWEIMSPRVEAKEDDEATEGKQSISQKSTGKSKSDIQDISPLKALPNPQSA